MEYALTGRVVLENRTIEEGVVIVRNGQIVYAGEKKDMPERVIHKPGKWIIPGFVDIHNHLWENAPTDMVKVKEIADAHLKQGTTSVLFTLYRDIPYEKLLEIFDGVKSIKSKWSQFEGIHMEGPYLNPKYGVQTEKDNSCIPNAKEYRTLIDKELVRQWTFAPEIPGTDVFLKDIVKAGIVPAIGHSEAEAECVFKTVKNGVGIVTHMFDAIGNAGADKGVRRFDTALAAMLCDSLYYEIICDKEEAHVQHDLIRLLIKCVGIDKVVGITDCSNFPQANHDARIVNGELNGSSMTMRRVAQNLRSMGIGMEEICKITSTNPAKAIRADREIGSIKAGKRANLIITDLGFKEMEVYLDGEIVATNNK